MDQITLQNFRCFREEQTARLAPLTILVGQNSAGKTSLLALVRALWDIAYRQRNPDFKEDPYDLGSFDEIIHNRGPGGKRADSFEAGFSGEIERGKKKAKINFDVVFSRQRSGTTPGRIRVGWRGLWIEFDLLEGELKVRIGTKRGVWQRSMPEGFADLVEDEPERLWTYFYVFGVARADENRSEWISLHGPSRPSEEDWKKIEEFIHPVHGYFPAPQQRPSYASAPVRSKPRRTYDPGPRGRDSEGDYIPPFFAEMSFHSKRQWAALRCALESFGKGAGLFDEITVRPFGKKESEPFQIQVRKFGSRSKGPSRNLIDVGYGISQVLPVITELLRDDSAPLVLLQQPEVHLHPSAQAALGTLFCNAAGPNRQLIVETHSDHLLDRVRMDVRDGTTMLKPDDVSILFFERSDLDVRIHSLRIDEEGNILDAPPGYRRFFMEETNRLIGL